MMINKYFVILLASGLNPGAIMLIIVPLNRKNISERKRVMIIDRLIKVEYISENSSLSFMYLVHTGTRNALVAPEKKRVCINSGKLKATINASTNNVAPNRYA